MLNLNNLLCLAFYYNRMKAIKGTLRENGKLIISLNDSDLIEMIQWKIDNRLPSDYLYELLDNMLIELEK